MTKTKIEWADRIWNPVVVNGEFDYKFEYKLVEDKKKVFVEFYFEGKLIRKHDIDEKIVQLFILQFGDKYLEKLAEDLFPFFRDAYVNTINILKERFILGVKEG
jgi:hypothetical protein